MKRTRRFGFSTLVLAALAMLAFAGSGGVANASPSEDGPVSVDPQLIEQLKASAEGTVAVHLNRSTNFAGFVRVSRGGDLLPADRSTNPQRKARGFLTEFGGLFGIRNVRTELKRTSIVEDRYGATHVSYEQVYQGVPVFGGVVRVHLDAANDLTAINGVFVPSIDVDASPRLSEAQAAERAIAAVAADPPRSEENADAGALDPASLSAASTKLYVYRVGLIRAAPGPNYLAYRVEVTNGANVRDVVFVHAHAGKVLNRYSLIDNALFRRLFEQDLDHPVWVEGDPLPGTLNLDQLNIVQASGHSYYHYFNAFGRDSYDGAGHELWSINNDPRIGCPNANWNGLTTNYCNGVTADDVVAHEWGHAYTQYTHNLIYQWQPGALNEAYSDIWGELTDLINGYGTDSPQPVRGDSCSDFTTGIPVLIINSPAPIAQECAAAGASFGPPLTGAGVTGDVALANDGVGVGSDACTPLVNGAEVSGKIALVDRGTCTFVIKVKNAQDAGAIAVVVVNNVVGPPQPMGGADPTITIPSVMISLAHGTLIKAELGTGVNVTMRAGGGATEASYRWLMGEDATAFGEAIRDMWKPTCLGDPGKVTDAEYHCATTDGGGVHTNSGVPNHGFALLVDGGLYNGQTIDSIGMVKAAHIYWRAESVYQTLTSGFPEHADSLEASCADLTGINLEGLSTTPIPAGPSGEIIDAEDCAAVTAMVAAVELRTDPSQCNFLPLLAKNAPRLCDTREAPTIWTEDFEDGLDGWTLTNEGVYSGWPDLDWVQDTTLPGGRLGAAAYAVNPEGGDCGGGEGDFSGVMRMESPAISIPANNSLAFRLTFSHYVATEGGFDGGNLKVSINGGAYASVPATAFRFNPYNTTLVPAFMGNTNPLAGQPAYSGTDGGEVAGSWGQTQLDLSALGVQPGDTLRLRFDFGMDGCTGIDGWYVDNVRVRACYARSTPGSSARDSRGTT